MSLSLLHRRDSYLSLPLKKTKAVLLSPLERRQSLTRGDSLVCLLHRQDTVCSVSYEWKRHSALSPLKRDTECKIKQSPKMYPQSTPLHAACIVVKEISSAPAEEEGDTSPVASLLISKALFVCLLSYPAATASQLRCTRCLLYFVSFSLFKVYRHLNKRKS